MKNLIYITSLLIFAIILLAANKVERVEYSPYQILVFELKANEGYRNWWYKDGRVNGKQAYSIGLGWNDQGSWTRRKEIAKFTQDKKVTLDEAVQISLMEIKKYGRLHKDPYKNLALVLHSYNCGLTTSGKELGKCCGAAKGCGNANKNIKKSHNGRRKFELALWNRNMSYISERTEENREIIIKTKTFSK